MFAVQLLFVKFDMSRTYSSVNPLCSDQCADPSSFADFGGVFSLQIEEMTTG